MIAAGKFSKLLFLLSLLTLVGLVDPVRVSAAGYPGLRSLPTRPSVLDVKRELNPFPAANPFPRGIAANPLYLQQLNQKLPKMIAAFEKAYPGATWAFLGRDSAWLYDIFQAFYDAVGEPNRVVFVPMSRSSLSGNADDILDFVRTYGLDAEKLDERHPYILVDRTTYNPGTSQLRLILSAVYSDYARRHQNDARPLVKKVNGISVGHYLQNPVLTTDREVFFRQFALRLLSNEPTQIMSYDTGQMANNLNQNTEWHGQYQRFERQGNTVISRPGAVGSQISRDQILSEMYEILSVVQSPDFIAQVGREASALGLQWDPRARPKPQPAAEPSAAPPVQGLPPTQIRVPPTLRQRYDRALAEDVLRDIRHPQNEEQRKKAMEIFMDWLKIGESRDRLFLDFGNSKRLAHIMEDNSSQFNRAVLQSYTAALQALGALDETFARVRNTCVTALNKLNGGAP